MTFAGCDMVAFTWEHRNRRAVEFRLVREVFKISAFEFTDEQGGCL